MLLVFVSYCGRELTPRATAHYPPSSFRNSDTIIHIRHFEAPTNPPTTIISKLRRNHSPPSFRNSDESTPFVISKLLRRRSEKSLSHTITSAISPKTVLPVFNCIFVRTGGDLVLTTYNSTCPLYPPSSFYIL
jgi:hypothetical protein